MKVYLLVRESYVYWDNEHDVSIKTFKDRQSAINYLTIEKEMLLAEAMHELNVTSSEEIRELYENDEVVYAYENEIDSYYIEIEEWGYDILSVQEHDIMEFDM